MRKLAPHRPSAAILCTPMVGDEIRIGDAIWRITQRCGNAIYAGLVNEDGTVPYDRAPEYARQRPS